MLHLTLLWRRLPIVKFSGDSLAFKRFTSNTMKSILAFGNPLLDITVSSKKHVQELIEKYNLKSDTQKEISRAEMCLLSKDIEGLEGHISPGGCCQNSLRVLQWVSEKRCKASVFGSVGKDHDANILRNALENDGVHPRYIEQDDLPTGKTIALVDGLRRTLTAHIGAAEVFPLQSLLSYENFDAIFDSTDIVFIEAFFLTNRFETAKYIVKLCQSKEKLLVFNLCGEYIFHIIPESIKYLVQHSNIIFGNLNEFNVLKSLLNYPSTEELAKDLLSKAKTVSNYEKMLLITNGKHPITCFYEDKVLSLLPPPMEKSEIKDTTAAGDAFVGGFLAGICASKNVEDCIRIGFYSAANILKQSGCSIPNYKPTILTL